jgi:hypothetical protein
MGHDVRVMRIRGSLMGIAVLAAVAGCTTSSTGGPVGKSSAANVAPSLGEQPQSLSTVSFCVGTSAKHHDGSVVTVHFMRGSVVLAEPMMQVPIRVSVQISPGPFSVVVDGVAQFSGSASPGQTVSGSMGQNCPR